MPIETLKGKEFEIVPVEGGSVEVITGGMFSGKSDELIRRIKRAPHAKKQVQVFAPIVDSRRGNDSVNTQDGIEHPAISVNSSVEILKIVDKETDWVAIDEAQFFDKNLPVVCELLALSGKRVIVAGLDADFKGKRFGPMDELMRLADKIDKLNANCSVCGRTASRTQRIVNGKPANYKEKVVLIGAEESYEARCRYHHKVPGKPRRC